MSEPRAIKLVISDEAYRIVRTEVMVHKMCHADGLTTLETFVAKIMGALENGEDEVTIQARSKKR